MTLKALETPGYDKFVLEFCQHCFKKSRDYKKSELEFVEHLNPLEDELNVDI